MPIFKRTTSGTDHKALAQSAGDKYRTLSKSNELSAEQVALLRERGAEIERLRKLREEAEAAAKKQEERASHSGLHAVPTPG